uniref:Vacuolar protein sorting-associated protein 53 homolog n=1 Tax=Macrostomum lignano TaxID=282301 RepID=A0A1I8F1A9_9PLAT
MRDIKERADRSEAAVLDLTRDIRRLDTAKRNLTGSITALNQVVILINGVDEMKALMLRNDRPYDALAQCLGKIHEVTAGLDRFMDIPQLQQLRNEARSLEAELSGRVKTELRDLLTGPPRELQQQRGQVEACCRLADLMDFRVRTEVLDKFVQQQLAEYAVLFEETQEAAWLTKIDSRFGWMKKFVLGFEERYARLFPSNWRVTQRLVKEFCDITRSQLKVLMQKRAKELDVKLLLFAVERTRLFEEQVVTAFKEKEDPSSAADPSASSTQQAAEQLFTGQYRNSVDRNLAEMLQRWTQDVSAPLDRGNGAAAQLRDLFMVYKNSLKNVRQAILRPANAAIGSRICQISARIRKQNPAGQSAYGRQERPVVLAGGFFSESTKLSNDDLSRVCVVILHRRVLLETTNQLEAKLRERINEQLTGEVDLRSEKDNFHSRRGVGLRAAANSHAEDVVNTVEAVGDQSPYVSSIGSHLSTNVPVIRDGLTSSRKYFTQFCSKFVSTFAPKFRAALFKCRPVSTVGAEQLLLDTHSLKTLLLSLPSLASPLQRKPPAAYTKLVVREMTKAEMLMKHSWRVFSRLLPDSDLTEYQKVLDMKGVKRSEQMALIDAYRAAKPNDAVLRPSPSASSLSAASAGGGGGGSAVPLQAGGATDKIAFVWSPGDASRRRCWRPGGERGWQDEAIGEPVEEAMRVLS